MTDSFSTVPTQADEDAYAASRETTHLAEPGDPVGSLPRARADVFPDPLLQQRAPLREAPLERIGIAEALRNRSQGLWTAVPGPRHRTY